MPKKWARVKTAGAHGLRRGAWYPVVNDSKPNLVVLDVAKRNVPVDRTILDFSESLPARWSVVHRRPTDPASKRASDANMDPTYVVCPKCRGRSNVKPGDTALQCPDCGGEFGIDWENPC